ncbi:MAG TPA: anthranilate synthase component I [Gemmatimonadales bacterium]|nr:anthranilate synthase component I [Gemmatimonadales bacterium]
MSGRFEDFARRAAAGGIVPVTREVVLDGDTPVSAFEKIHRGRFGFLLESLEGGERWARYTFLATEPREVLAYHGRECRRWAAGEEGWRVVATNVAPLDHLAIMMRSHPPVSVPGLPRFTGGAVGFLGYDIVRTLERLPAPPPDDRDIPDAMLMVVDTLLVLDNLYNRATVIANAELSAGADHATLHAAFTAAETRIDTWLRRLEAPNRLQPLAIGPVELPATHSEFTQPRFEAAVAAIKEYITAGDTFQTVLSRRSELPAPPPMLAYRYLRALNPAPYLYYLQFDDTYLVGSSPEILVRVEEGEVTLRPIAGTRPRGATPDADQALEHELLADPKERAEHLMLVDLGRNDVGRVAAYGTVRLTAFMTVERYSHVMHLVSEVRGTLRPELDALSALGACFPAGTVSGAPKVRAMEIIDELEPVRRGPYAGAVGYVGWGARTLDTAIAIRTCVIKGDRAWIQAGAGVVADSDPTAEFNETEAKAKAVLTALALASRTQP